MPFTRAPFRSLLVALATTMIVLVSCAGCGSGSGGSAKGEPAGCTKVPGSSFTLTARNLAWSPSCLQVKAGTTVHFTVKLDDIGVQHNLVVYGQGEKTVQTKLETGPATEHLIFTFTSAGYYQYKCSIHPDMTGVIYAV